MNDLGTVADIVPYVLMVFHMSRRWHMTACASRVNLWNPKKIWHRPMTLVHPAVLVAPALVPWGQGSWGGLGGIQVKTNLFVSWCSSWRSPCSPRNWWRHSVDLGPDGKVTCQLWKCQRPVFFCVISGRLSHHHCPIKMVDYSSSVTTQNVWFITCPKKPQKKSCIIPEALSPQTTQSSRTPPDVSFNPERLRSEADSFKLLRLRAPPPRSRFSDILIWGWSALKKMHVLGPKVDSKAVFSMKLIFKTILIKWLLSKKLLAVLIIRRFCSIRICELWSIVTNMAVTSLEEWGETMRVFTDRKLVSCDAGQGLRNENHKLMLKLLCFLFAHASWESAISILIM